MPPGSKKYLPELTEAELQALDHIRKEGPLSRTSIAEMLGTSRASVTALARNLLEVGLLVEIGHGKSEGGRRPRLLDVNAEMGFIAGVDLGATSVDLALADFRGNILSRNSFYADVRSEPKILLEKINALILTMLIEENAAGADLLGFGMGVPGPVHFPSGLLIKPPLMPEWEGYPIKQFVRQQFPNTNPAIDNDVNIMAIGEARMGGGIGLDNFLYVKIGTGVGCGIITDGEIYRGSDGCAGDIGHICIDYNGPVCHCGNTGCLEFMAAGPAIAKNGMLAAKNGESEKLAARMEANGGVLSSKDIGELAASGDQAANKIINDSGKMIGGMLAGLVNFYNPEAIFIGGGVSKIGHQFLSTIRQLVLKRATALSTRSLAIDYSGLGGDEGVHGAIWLAIENVFAPVK